MQQDKPRVAHQVTLAEGEGKGKKDHKKIQYGIAPKSHHHCKVLLLQEAWSAKERWLEAQKVDQEER